MFIIISIIVIAIILILHIRRTSRATHLPQPESFYKQHRDETIKYLLAVYPTAQDSLTSLCDIELGRFYNSLWFYYNCAGKASPDLGLPAEDQWDALPCAINYPLPYVPSGWLYNYYAYKLYNVPEIYSDSDSSKPYLKIENATSTKPGVMMGPDTTGVVWYTQRTIQRDIWHPNGIHNIKNNLTDEDKWVVSSGAKATFSYPSKWFGGFKDNSFVEVSHSPANIGDAVVSSPFWWYNANFGSGIFLNLGKTVAFKNKVGGLIGLAKMLAKSARGRDVLFKHYNTRDPYNVVWQIVAECKCNPKLWFCAGDPKCNGSNPEYVCQTQCVQKSDGFGQAIQLSAKLETFAELALKHQGGTVLTEAGKRRAINAAADNKNFYMAHISEQTICDEPNFFFAIHLGLDTVQFYEDPNANDNYCFEIIDVRIPKDTLSRALERDYSGIMNLEDDYAHSYKNEVIDAYLKSTYDNNWLSIRDPLDVHNESKVLKCEGLYRVNDASNTYCAQIPLANAFRRISFGRAFNPNCRLTGPDPDC